MKFAQVKISFQMFFSRVGFFGVTDVDSRDDKYFFHDFSGVNSFRNILCQMTKMYSSSFANRALELKFSSIRNALFQLRFLHIEGPFSFSSRPFRYKNLLTAFI